MGDKNYPLSGPWDGDDLPRGREPMIVLRRQVPRLAQIFDVLLRYRGGHPLALETGYIHCWGSRGKRKFKNLGTGARRWENRGRRRREMNRWVLVLL